MPLLRIKKYYVEIYNIIIAIALFEAKSKYKSYVKNLMALWRVFE